MKRKKNNGRSGDLTFSWLTHSHGEDWLQWQQYATEWMATQDAGVHHRLEALRHFFETYLVRRVSYAKEPFAFFSGRGEHRVSTEEFVEEIRSVGVKSQGLQADYVACLVSFLSLIHI